MHKIRSAVMTALALCVSGLVLAAPAQASIVTVEGSCDTWAGTMSGRAHFNRDDATGWRNWYLFAAKVNGPTLGNKNNINLYFFQDYAQHWTSFSPDNVGKNAWYSAGANINMPPWSIQFARWEGIFDVSGGDPSCSEDSEQVYG